MSQLEQFFTQYGTDKGIWGYTPAYETHLGPIRNVTTRVLEIGICGHRDIPNNVVGASLFAWRDYFPFAEIYGVDNDSRFVFNDKPRIHTALCDAYSQVELGGALHTWGTKFDFICDDAVHDPGPQIELCTMLWPWLNPGGVYAIEEACPYKCPNNDLYSVCRALMVACPTLENITEYQTHKDERLLVLTKAK
jgi:8-demethyl-8-alpha-L-rhamnosyltetracenomycin-C 2'-O-methyltransferase